MQSVYSTRIAKGAGREAASGHCACWVHSGDPTWQHLDPLSINDCVCVLLIVLQSKPPAPKRELLLPVNNSSKENGVRVEQDDQDLFAGESASLSTYWCFLNSELGVIFVLAMICLWLGCLFWTLTAPYLSNLCCALGALSTCSVFGKVL